MTLSILGIGTALPPHRIAQADAARLAAQLIPSPNGHTRRMAALYRRSGVESRHSALLHASPGEQDDLLEQQTFYRPFENGEEETSSKGPTTRRRMEAYARFALDLATRAARGALVQAGVAPGRVTHLVTVSCSGFDAPGVDIRLIEALGLSRGVERTHVGFMGCHGSLNGLRAARAYCGADPEAVVLLCAVELCSLHFQYSQEADQQVANSLFADGAAALVGTAAGTPLAATRPQAWQAIGSGSFVLPDSLDAMTWTIGDHGFAMTLSARVPELIRRDLRGWVEGWLGRNGLAPEAIATWAIHPGGPRILQAASEALGLAEGALAVSRGVLAECGNMSSPTILFILKRLIEAGAPGPCAALAFGPGLVVEGSLFAGPEKPEK